VNSRTSNDPEALVSARGKEEASGGNTPLTAEYRTDTIAMVSQVVSRGKENQEFNLVFIAFHAELHNQIQPWLLVKISRKYSYQKVELAMHRAPYSFQGGIP
jgi:hypothetical protein